jgi:hypothetical protein
LLGEISTGSDARTGDDADIQESSLPISKRQKELWKECEEIKTPGTAGSTVK